MRAIGLLSGTSLHGVDVALIETDDDRIQAQAFAYMAVRTLKGLPITFPTTTGVARPLARQRRRHFVKVAPACRLLSKLVPRR